MKIRRTVKVLASVAAASIAAPMITSAPAAAEAAPVSYVALGDSYTSGSGVFPSAPGSHPACTQTSLNYPHLVAGALGLALDDVSCGAATVQDMTQPQFGFVPPQFDALQASTDVVTLSIGGNDNMLFASTIAICGPLNLGNVLNIGAPCKSAMGSYFDNLIDSDAPKIAQALQGIHDRSPDAKVFVVGYPQVLPQTGNCYPTIPLSTGDVAYLNGIHKHLNAMLATQAAANDATFVDTWTASTGHDACKPVGVRWVEPVFPNVPKTAAVLHPNAAGLAADARAVKAAFASAGIG